MIAAIPLNWRNQVGSPPPFRLRRKFRQRREIGSIRRRRGERRHPCLADLGGPSYRTSTMFGFLQCLAKRWSPGCVNAAGKARQKWYARAVTTFTKPGNCLLAEPCNVSTQVSLYVRAFASYPKLMICNSFHTQGLGRLV